MQRARRSVQLVALALAGAATLTGCRSEPGVAIYLGGVRHTQREVDALAVQLRPLSSAGLGDARTRVVQWLVLRDLIKRTATAEKWGAAQVDVDGAASKLQPSVQQAAEQAATAALGDHPSEEKVNKAQAELADKVAAQMRTIRPAITLYAEFQAYLALAQQHVSSGPPPDADYAELFQRAKEGGLIQPGTTEAQFREGLNAQDGQAVAANFGLRDLLAGMVKHSDLTINPRYSPARVALLGDGNGHDLIVLSLDGKPRSAPVRGA
jgi:hypothetical protein